MKNLINEKKDPFHLSNPLTKGIQGGVKCDEKFFDAFVEYSMKKEMDSDLIGMTVINRALRKIYES